MSLVFTKTPVVQFTRVNDNEHWEGRLYPEWMLAKMGEADNVASSPEEAGWEQQHDNQEGN